MRVLCSGTGTRPSHDGSLKALRCRSNAVIAGGLLVVASLAESCGGHDVLRTRAPEHLPVGHVTTTSTRTAGAAQTFTNVAVIVGARTADQGNALVLIYSTGGCAGESRSVPTATDTESTSAVTVQVSMAVTRKGPVCADFGLGGFVNLPLHTALGTRRLIDESSGKTIVVFNGDGLLEPTWSPPGYVLRSEGPDGTAPTDRWIRVWGLVPTVNSNGCVPAPQDIVLREGYGLAQFRPPTSIPPPTNYQVSGQVAQVDTSDYGMLFWHPANHPPGWQVGVLTQEKCRGDQPLPIDTLIRFGDGLR